jgi:predicted restriction endonuclease
MEEPIDIGNDNWWGFDAAHIFPIAHENDWKIHNFSRWISLPPARGEPINSVQNGLLLRSDIHILFDNYAFSINPDVCILYPFYEVTVG